MASIIPVGNKWRAQVRRKGLNTETKTFDKKKDAKEWATKLESEIDAGKNVGILGRTGILVADAIGRFREENPDLGTQTYSLTTISRGLGHLYLDKITDDDIVAYFKKRDIAKMTVSMEFSLINTIFNVARIAWKYAVPNILPDARLRLKMMGLIGGSRQRDRRPTPNEINRLCEYDFGGDIPMADIIMFAISSAMRQAEITRININTFERAHKTIVITDRKHPTKKIGNHKTVPLIDASIEIIERQTPDDNGVIFPYNSKTICTYFMTACKVLGINNLHFHDLRHEGTSRLFEMGYQIHEVAMFTGHEDWKQLKRYTQLKAKDIRRLAPVVQIDEARRIKELEDELAKLKKSKAA